MYTTAPAVATPTTVAGYPAAAGSSYTYVTASSGAMPAGATVVRSAVPGQTVVMGGAMPTQVIRSPAGAQPVTYATSPQVVRTVAAGQSLTSTVRTVAAPGTAVPAGLPAGSRVVYTTSSAASPAGTRVISTGGAAPGQYYVGQYTQQAYEQKHMKVAEDPQLKNLKELRRTCGLKNVPVAVGLNALKEAAVDNKLVKDDFLVAYRNLLTSKGIEVPDEKTQHAVFDLFDRDDNGTVDMMELICGISLLCEGTEDDKIAAIFNIFDENGDGFISMDEMYKFLTAVFKVVLTPNVMGVMRSMGVEVESAEDLASVTSLECFKAADLNHDGKLSLQEFHNWFYAPKNDPSFLFSPVRKLLQ